MFTFCFVNVMTQLIGGEPISPDILTGDASAAFPFGLCNAAVTVASLVARGHMPTPADIEFIGMADHVVDSIYNILSSGSETLFDSDSSAGSHHLSRECFMVEVSEGQDVLESTPQETLAHTGRVPLQPTPAASAPPRLNQPCLEQLQVRQQELEEA